MTGQVFAVVGPSGAGKDTVMRAIHERRAQLRLARRVITRPSGDGSELHQFVTETDFARLCQTNAFALHWEAHGLRYGIPASVKAQVKAGEIVMFNGSRAMLEDAKRVFPGLHVLHITASDEVLRQRLIVRGRESETQIISRLARVRAPLPEGLNLSTIDNSGLLEHAVLAALRTMDRAASESTVGSADQSA